MSKLFHIQETVDEGIIKQETILEKQNQTLRVQERTSDIANETLRQQTDMLGLQEKSTQQSEENLRIQSEINLVVQSSQQHMRIMSDGVQQNEAHIKRILESSEKAMEVTKQFNKNQQEILESQQETKDMLKHTAMTSENLAKLIMSQQELLLSVQHQSDHLAKTWKTCSRQIGGGHDTKFHEGGTHSGLLFHMGCNTEDSVPHSIPMGDFVTRSDGRNLRNSRVYTHADRTHGRVYSVDLSNGTLVHRVETCDSCLCRSHWVGIHGYCYRESPCD